MRTFLEFIARISLILYVLAGVGVYFGIRGLFQGRRKRRVAVFGLEREEADAQQRNAVTIIVTLLALAGVVYVIDNIVVPNVGISQGPATATPIVFVQPETPTPQILLFPTVTPTVGLPSNTTDTTAEAPQGCDIIGATVASPASGDNVSGQVAVEGEANILDFGQYKFEVRGAGTGDAWVTVGAYQTPVSSGLLGVWDSTSLPLGEYTFRLVVFYQDGSAVTPCEVPIKIVRPPGVPGG